MTRTAGIAIVLFLWAAPSLAQVATDQRQVAIGYERLETLALRIADTVEESDPARADQVRAAIGEARTLGVTGRFAKVVDLLERERYAAARRDQTELATQLEELLRLVMADPNASRLEEERERLELLRREVRAALREQRALRARASRGEAGELVERQEELANRIERLREPAEETDRLNGKLRGEPSDAQGDPKQGDGQPGESQPSADGAEPQPGEESGSIAERLQSASESSRDAGRKFAEEDPSAKDDQLEAQRELEAAQRETEERLRQIREEEKQRRLASLAERFRHMHEAQVGLVADTQARADASDDDQSPASRRSTQLAAAKLAARQADVRSAAEQALRVVRADGSSRVFDDALSQTIDDALSAESRLKDAQLDPTTVALEQIVADAIAVMIAAVDDSLDEMEQQKSEQQGQGQQGQSGGEQGLVSKIAELRMIRAIQARLMRQTEVWRVASVSGSSDPEEVAQRLRRLADEQRRLTLAVETAAGGAP